MPRGSVFFREEVDSLLDNIEDVCPVSITHWDHLFDWPSYAGTQPVVEGLQRQQEDHNYKQQQQGQQTMMTTTNDNDKQQ